MSGDSASNNSVQSTIQAESYQEKESKGAVDNYKAKMSGDSVKLVEDLGQKPQLRKETAELKANGSTVSFTTGNSSGPQPLECLQPASSVINEVPKENQLIGTTSKSGICEERAEIVLTDVGVADIEKYFIKHSKIPDNANQPYVVSYFVHQKDDGNFRCFVSTRNLLKNAVNRNVLCTQSTYKIWEGFPLSPIGTTDGDRNFHLYGTLLSKEDKTADFEFAFRSIQTAVKVIYSHDVNPSIFISDSTRAIDIAARNVFGPQIIIMISWVHMKHTLKIKLAQLIKNEGVENAILSDVEKLQQSQNHEIFHRASGLFLQKYIKYEKFCEYFNNIWIIENPNWYEGCTSIPSSSTNNALEYWMSSMKKEKTYRNLYTLNEFLDLFLGWHLEWSEKEAKAHQRQVI